MVKQIKNTTTVNSVCTGQQGYIPENPQCLTHTYNIYIKYNCTESTTQWHKTNCEAKNSHENNQLFSFWIFISVIRTFSSSKKSVVNWGINQSTLI